MATVTVIATPDTGSTPLTVSLAISVTGPEGFVDKIYLDRDNGTDIEFIGEPLPSIETALPFSTTLQAVYETGTYNPNVYVIDDDINVGSGSDEVVIVGEPALTTMQRYISIMIEQIQECENELQNFTRVRDIKTVVGGLLDIAGEMVGEDRLGRTDDEYRVAIQFKILLNVSNGEPETLIQGLRIFTNSQDIRYSELWPAKVNFDFTSVTTPPSNLRDLLEQIAPAGVKVLLNWIPEGPFFSVDGEGGYPPEADTAGFDEEQINEIDIDFNTYPIVTWGFGDEGTATIQDAGATIFIEGNSWKKVVIDYMVTNTTILTFDYKSTIEGEIQGIGFGTSDDHDPTKLFKVFGTQSFGIKDFDNYTLPDGWKTYSIPIGTYYTGQMNLLGFVNDHDLAPKNGNGYYRNVKITDVTIDGGGQLVEEI